MSAASARHTLCLCLGSCRKKNPRLAPRHPHPQDFTSENFYDCGQASMPGHARPSSISCLVASFIIGMPLALGSLWGVLFSPVLLAALGLRAILEERTLIAEAWSRSERLSFRRPCSRLAGTRKPSRRVNTA